MRYVEEGGGKRTLRKDGEKESLKERKAESKGIIKITQEEVRKGETITGEENEIHRKECELGGKSQRKVKGEDMRMFISATVMNAMWMQAKLRRLSHGQT